MRQQRKGSRAAKKRKADRIFSEKIRAIGKCAFQGLDNISCSDQLQCAHIVGRSNHNLRWDSINALPLCSGHHRWYTSHPFEWTTMIMNHFKDRYDYLMEYKDELWDKDIDKVLEDLSEWKSNPSD